MKIKNNHIDHEEGTKDERRGITLYSPCSLRLKKLKLTAMSFQERLGRGVLVRRELSAFI